MLARYGLTTTEYQSVTTSTYKRLDENLRVPDVGQFVQIKHWDELGKINKNEFPEMINVSMGLLLRDPNGRAYDYVEMPDSWQWFLWSFWDWASAYKLPRGKIEEFYQRPNNPRTFAKTTPGSLSYVYVDMVEAHRAFTEAGSPEAGARDVVTNRNMSNPKAYQWLFFPTGGAMLKVVREVSKYYEVEALDVLKPPPSIEYVTSRPWLYFWCTQYGKYTGSTRFPQIKNANAVHGLPPVGTPSLLMSKGGTFRILKTSCRILKNGATWTPYNPA